MKEITVRTTLREIYALPELTPLSKYLIYSPSDEPQDESGRSFSDTALKDLKSIGWSPEGIAAGVNFLLNCVSQSRVRQHFIYPNDENAGKRDVNLLQLDPEQPDPQKPFVLLCAGGAYQSVCTLVEALPTARHMVAAGYRVFLLTYRVGIPQAALHALDDLVSAVDWLGEHAATLHIDPARYAVGGFSAGANLISNWGCPELGWQHYGLPKPMCLFPIYTFIDLKTEASRDEHGGLLGAMFGEDWPQYLDRFHVTGQIDGDYPPCYIVCSKDDAVVPCRNSEMMKERLDAAGISAVLDEAEHAQHGFGDGTGTGAEGWPLRALGFLESLL